MSLASRAVTMMLPVEDVDRPRSSTSRNSDSTTSRRWRGRRPPSSTPTATCSACTTGRI